MLTDGGLVAEERVLTVPPGVPGLGVSLTSFPPRRVHVLDVRTEPQLDWAQSSGVHPGDEIIALNDVLVRGMTPESLKEYLARTRPLRVTFLRARGQRTVIVPETMQLLGLRFIEEIGPMVVARVAESSWASFVGCRQGDELVTVDGLPLADISGGRQGISLALQQRPVRLGIYFGERGPAKESDPRRFLAKLPTLPADLLLVLDPDIASPRGYATTQLLRALAAEIHDSAFVRKAIVAAREAGVPHEGIVAAEQALEALGGPDSVCSAEARKDAVARLRGVLSSRHAGMIRAAAEAAIEAGIDDEPILAAAEDALTALYAGRGLVMDAVVDALEVAVSGAETQPATGCTAPLLAQLADAIEAARRLAGPQDDEFLALATQLWEFESQRRASLGAVRDAVQKRCAAMDFIASQAAGSALLGTSVAVEAAARELGS